MAVPSLLKGTCFFPSSLVILDWESCISTSIYVSKLTPGGWVGISQTWGWG